MKIRKKVEALAVLRDRLTDAEDRNDVGQAELLRGQTDVEERKLNDMLSEWWHRIRFYEASVAMLDTYNEAQRKKEAGSGEHGNVVLLSRATESDIRFTFSKATQLDLNHFLSTCAEILPEFSSEEIGAKQDIELAVGKFLAMNDEKELTSLFFKLQDDQRLTAANLTVELMLNATSSTHAQELIEGKAPLAAIPTLRGDISRMLTHSQSKSFTLAGRPNPQVGVGRE